jgi:hypothetical protein
MSARPPFAEAVRHEVLLTPGDDYHSVIVVVIPAESEMRAAFVATKAEDHVPDPRYGGLWHVGHDGDGRAGASFHLIERGRGHSGLERVWAIYGPPESLVSAISDLPHLVALLLEEHAGPDSQPTIELRQRLVEALVVEVENHSATMQMLLLSE